CPLVEFRARSWSFGPQPESSTMAQRRILTPRMTEATMLRMPSLSRMACVAGVLLPWCGNSYAQQQPPPSVTVGTPPSQTISVEPGVATTVSIDRPFASATPGNATIIDVLPVSDRTLLITPQKVGNTNILFFDAQSVPIANVGVQVSATP